MREENSGKAWDDRPVSIRLGVPPGDQASRRAHEAAAAIERLIPAVRVELRPPGAADLDGELREDLTPAQLAEKRSVEWVRLPAAAPYELGPLLTFPRANWRLMRIRDLFVKTIVFAGAGPSRPELITIEADRALRRCDVCLHDALIDPRVLDALPPHALPIGIGKRGGRPSASQSRINDLLVHHASEGRRVVRLKGGDPGIFGRLGEEIESVASHSLPFRVIPGVGCLNAASAAGFVMTRRGMAHGFTAASARLADGLTARLDPASRAEMPLVLFMASSVIRQVAAELMAGGLPGDTPAAILFGAGSDRETIVQSTLGSNDLVAAAGARTDLPGLLIVGDPARRRLRSPGGAMRSRRIMLTCDGGALRSASAIVQDLGGVPLAYGQAAQPLPSFDAIVFSRARAVRAFAELPGLGAISGVTTIVAAGIEAERALLLNGVTPCVTIPQRSSRLAVRALAGHLISSELAMSPLADMLSAL